MSRAQRPRARAVPAWLRLLQPPVGSADLATAASPPPAPPWPCAPTQGGGPGSWASAKPAPTSTTGGQRALWAHLALLSEGGAPPDSAQGLEDPEAPRTATRLGGGRAASCAAPRPQGPASTPCPARPGLTAAARTAHLWQRSPKPSRGCSTPLDDSPWVRNSSTGLCRARPWEERRGQLGAEPGAEGPPLAGRPLPEGLFLRRAGQDAPGTPTTLGAARGLRALGRAEVGAGRLGSWGGGLIGVRDFVPETQGGWPRPPASPVGATMRRTESPGLGLVGRPCPGGRGWGPECQGMSHGQLLAPPTGLGS